MFVVKRNGIKVNFNENKIKIALEKAFKATRNNDTNLVNYLIPYIINKCNELTEKNKKDSITVEEIQDIVEKSLMEFKLFDEAKKYILYREKRTEMRNSKISECIDEILTKESKDSNMKRDNANIDGDTAMGTMLQIGANASKLYYLDNVIKPEIAKKHRDGHIHIHDLDFYALTVTCCQIDLIKLFKNGFHTGHGFLREPNSIASYAALAAIAIQSDQNDCHGGQSVPNFDYALGLGVNKSLKKIFKDELIRMIDYCEDIRSEDFINQDFENIINNLTLSNFDEYMEKLNVPSREVFVKNVKDELDRETFQAMESFVHNLNTMHCLPEFERIQIYDAYEKSYTTVTIKELYENFIPYRYKIMSYNIEDCAWEWKFITNCINNGFRSTIVKTTTYDGNVVYTTDNHRFLVRDKDTNEIEEAFPKDIDEVLVSPDSVDIYNIVRNPVICARNNLFAVESSWKEVSYGGEVYDISVQDNENFVNADGILIHNSRAGAQVPFSSINLGTDTSEEGRLVTKNLLLAIERGLGHGEISIFPIVIFKVKSGINFNPEDKNYDLFKLSCRVTSKRLFPNFEFLDAPFNLQYYEKGRPETEVATMGCVQGDEIVRYLISYIDDNYSGFDEDEIYTSSIKEMYDKCLRICRNTSLYKYVKNNYIDLSEINVEIYDSNKHDFVKCKKIIRNRKVTNWMELVIDGMPFICTDDHPLPIYNSETNKTVRTYAKNIKIGDLIPTSDIFSKPTRNYDSTGCKPEIAWLYGYTMFNGYFDNEDYDIVIKFNSNRELEHIKRILENTYEEVKYEIIQDKIYVNFNDIFTDTMTFLNVYRLAYETEKGGIKTYGSAYESIKRFVPSSVYNNTDIKIPYILGIVESIAKSDNGIHYISLTDDKVSKMIYLLFKSVMPNTSIHKSENEYIITFDLAEIITSFSSKITVKPYRKIDSVKYIDLCEDSYDVETESDMFDVSGIVSHNCRTRVMGNVNGPEISHGRGNLSFTSINLPRLAIECNKDTTLFFKNLREEMELVKDQLLDRYKIQCNRKVKNMPFLMGQGVWIDSDNYKPNDRVEDVIKQGTLAIGFVGLAECMTALYGHHHGEGEEYEEKALDIIKFMRNYTDEITDKYHLNFGLLATPAESLAGRFLEIDKKEFGIIPGVTDKDFYTNSFHIPVNFKITVFEKIKLEAPFHQLTNGGHITYVELDGDTSNNVEVIEKIVRYMAECGIGYGSINHPVDRDPVCGYTGVINDECPNCHREETSENHFERIRRITGYLVGDLSRWNKAKKAEESMRIKHNIINNKKDKDNE